MSLKRNLKRFRFFYKSQASAQEFFFGFSREKGVKLFFKKNQFRLAKKLSNNGVFKFPSGRNKITRIKEPI
jgi:hypothetical protein